ncbi:hypothetical protein CGL56_10495 [Neolewinella marina]|uniref:Uncharacterized protein n=2 Tax=Neolewinella marina TaxID=438751 RepID=A0A2G0CFY4_9BACT|nr:hypothetical protein CGL56_10495 [Neolewinella marina]
MVACLLFLLASVWVHWSLPTSYSLLFRDVGAEVEMPVSHGLFSQLGIILWSLGIGSLMLVLFTAPYDYRWSRGFVCYSMVVTLTLALDDAFRIHETLFAEVLGVGEGLAFAIYFLLITGYFTIYPRHILHSPWPLMVIALGLFAVSMGIDQTPGLANYVGYDEMFLLEDGSKLAGIIFWTLYQYLMGRNWLRRPVDDYLGTVPHQHHYETQQRARTQRQFTHHHD